MVTGEPGQLERPCEHGGAHLVIDTDRGHVDTVYDVDMVVNTAGLGTIRS